MSIVKIYPEKSNKSDFSIRFINSLYHVYEGDKLLLMGFENITKAEQGINSIISERIKNNVSTIVVFNDGFEPQVKQFEKYQRKHPIIVQKCKNCGETFNAIRNNHFYCSSKCRDNFKASNEITLENQLTFSKVFQTTNNEEIKIESSVEERITLPISKDTPEAEEVFRQMYRDRKRLNFFQDLVKLLYDKRIYELELKRSWNFDEFYKNLMRNNLIFFNRVNVFTLMPSLFDFSDDKFSPVSWDKWTDDNLTLAINNIVAKMIAMDTYATHQQQGALSMLLTIDTLTNDIMTMDSKVELLLDKVQALNKQVKNLEKQVESSKEDVNNKKGWFKF